jgi:catechol 2,3-dioxygenase-like lactoylglutathione lyase family enzyme
VATVRYLVNDIDTSLPFYEKLGFTLLERMGSPFAMVRRNDLTLWLSGPGSSAARTLPTGAQPVAGGWNRLVIEVEDIAKTVEELKSAGVIFRSEPISGPGGTQVLVDDPSGNPIELFQPR